MLLSCHLGIALALVVPSDQQETTNEARVFEK
jgi:hypothetical protein